MENDLKQLKKEEKKLLALRDLVLDMLRANKATQAAILKSGESPNIFLNHVNNNQ